MLSTSANRSKRRISFFIFFWAPTPVKSDTNDKLGGDGHIFFSSPKILTEKNPIFLHRPAVAVLL